MKTDSTEDIARAVAREQGREEWWRYYHPVVKWTIDWLNEHGYLIVVEERPLSVSAGDADV